eukprot:6183552-Pleurochrysis_carterae.AAC.4
MAALPELSATTKVLAFRCRLGFTTSKSGIGHVQLRDGVTWHSLTANSPGHVQEQQRQSDDEGMPTRTCVWSAGELKQ